MWLKKLFLFSVFLACVIFSFFAQDAKADVDGRIEFVAPSNQSTFSSHEIRLDNVTLNVKIADTLDKMEQGLQYNDPLPYDEGMLFIPQHPQVLPMWMPNMKFSLDMIWFDNDGNVLHIEKNVPPCTFSDQSTCPVYNQDGQPSQYALEVTSGFVNKYNITMNSKLAVPIPEFGTLAMSMFGISFLMTVGIFTFFSKFKNYPR